MLLKKWNDFSSEAQIAELQHRDDEIRLEMASNLTNVKNQIMNSLETEIGDVKDLHNNDLLEKSTKIHSTMSSK